MSTLRCRAITALFLLVACDEASSDGESETDDGHVTAGPEGPQYDALGSLMYPADYRKWVYVSTGKGMSYAETPEEAPVVFDNTFVNRSSYETFASTGTWPDGTMFVLEIRGVSGENALLTAGEYQTDLYAVEASVKDSTRYADTWAYFRFGTIADGFVPTTEPVPKEFCWTCHDSHAWVDNTFVQFYPVLRELAAPHGVLPQ